MEKQVRNWLGGSYPQRRIFRAAGAIVADAVAIVSYGFPEASDAFAKADVRFSALTDFSTILACATEAGKIPATDAETVRGWLAATRL